MATTRGLQTLIAKLTKRIAKVEKEVVELKARDLAQAAGGVSPDEPPPSGGGPGEEH